MATTQKVIQIVLDEDEALALSALSGLGMLNFMAATGGRVDLMQVPPLIAAVAIDIRAAQRVAEKIDKMTKEL